MAGADSPPEPARPPEPPPWQPVWDRLAATFAGRPDEPVPVDATDRLLLHEAADAIRTAGPGAVVILDDRFGALTLAAATALGVNPDPWRPIGRSAIAGPAPVRLHQDDLAAGYRLRRAAAACGMAEAFEWYPRLDHPSLLADARVVVAVLPRSLAALRDVAEHVAAYAAPDVTLFAGGRVKHMTPAMNNVLAESFGRVRASLARGKSRVLVATGALPWTDFTYPVTAQTDAGPVVSYGGAFAGAGLDLGTRTLLAALDTAPDAGRPAFPEEVTAVIDLGCGTGLLACWAARRWPDARVHAVDTSAAAVRSATLTARAQGVGDRVLAIQSDAGDRGDESIDAVDVVLCNPPFHDGAAVRTDAAHAMFAAAGRMLRPGGQLWCVWNSHLRYRPALERAVGPTIQVARDRKFTVTVSVRRAGL